ncbi:MAG: ADP-ribosylglycohydrolase family protein [Deltaproteobacteria bacterium]|nr:ADP-ribosylglycohydrolase family protein [Deltaproteobacteria bacterium]
MAHEIPGDILSTILRKRIDGLGYSSLKKFYEDRKELDCSYELLRQVVYGGRIPRSETLLRILHGMRFSSTQVQKIMEMHFGGFLRHDRVQRPSALSDADDGTPQTAPGGAAGGPETPSPLAGEGERQPPALSLHDPSEVAESLSRSLPKIPLQGNEDFWEMVRQLTATAERKVLDLARRKEDQPLLFGKEPEAVYHFLVRRAKAPPYLSRGESVPLAFTEGIDYEDRYRGALLGAAVGELLGRPAQGLSPRDVQELYGGIAGYAPRHGPEARPEGRSLALPGCLLLTRALIGSGRIDPEEIAATFTAAPHRTAVEAEYAANLTERGYPWFEAGVNAAESVPAARIAPLSLLRAGDFRRMKLEAGIIASVTHPNPASIAGAIAQAAAVARVLHTPRGTLDALGFARGISPAIAGIEPDRTARSRQSRQFQTLFRRLGTELAALLLRRAEIEEIRESLGNGTPVQEGLPFAWACFLRSPEDFAEAVLPAVNLGNDAEGTASMAGSLCGAYVGASGIPGRFLSGLPWREELAAAADGLLSLARREREPNQ